MAEGDEFSVGIDPGFANLGYALLRRSGVTPWTFERVATFKTSPKLPFHERMKILHGHLYQRLLAVRSMSFIGRNRVTVACEAQEGAQEGRRREGATNADALKVQQVVGMVRALCFQLDFPLVEPTTAQVKQVIGGISRTATKAQVQRAVAALVRELPTKLTEHEGDAVSAALAGPRLARMDALGHKVVAKIQKAKR